MASTVVLFVIAAFLSGAVTAVFAMLVVGVHAGTHRVNGCRRGFSVEPAEISRAWLLTSSRNLGPVIVEAVVLRCLFTGTIRFKEFETSVDKGCR
jgi:hypothetical protein